MSSSAKSTVQKDKRAETLLHTLPVLAITTFLAAWSGDLPAIAQSGARLGTADSPSSIPVENDIRSVRDVWASTSDASAMPATPAGETATVGAPSPRMIVKTFLATAYCLKGQTASGVVVRRGIIAADPRVLPLGSVVRLRAGRYSGIYTVMDTGGSIRGRRVDIYMPTLAEAMRFGTREVKIEVLRHGWDPESETIGAK